MPMNPTDLLELVNDQLKPAYDLEMNRLARIDLWYRWQAEQIIPPRGATLELKRLIEMANTPWLGLVVTNVAQSLRLDGYRSPDVGRDDNPVWRLFKANGLDRRQNAIHRSALAYGASYGLAMPGVDELSGEPLPRLRGVSPRKMLAFYADAAEDDWPLYALRKTSATTWRVYDDEVVYFLGVEAGELKYLEWRPHPAGVCPIVRFTNQLDLDGRADGEVEPFIGVAKRLNKTSFDRLMIQHFNSWKVRTVAGMAEPEDDEAARRTRLRLRADDLLIAEDPDTKFGTLDETPLDGILKAYETDVKTLAAISQTPTHALTGDMINLSAEALAAARSELEAKVAERQGSFGESWSKFLRLGSHIGGDTEAAADVLSEVTWADTSVRSMAQAADALGKLATMLGVPTQELWSFIPGVTKTDIEVWKEAAKTGDPIAQMNALLSSQATPPAPAPAP